MGGRWRGYRTGVDSDQIAALMLAHAHAPAAQQAQTRFRRQLVTLWGIEPGTRVLEIGCGQGDTTAVLAATVGPHGRVVAVDPAPPDYGAPVTVGDSAAYLREGPLGDRVEFRFGWDPERADPAADGPYDYVVFGHCSWYFDSADLLRERLAAARRWAATLCFSEWDLYPHRYAQVPHHLAVLALARYGPWWATRTGAPYEGNIRTPLSRERATALIAAAGWAVVAEERADSTGLSDGEWEVAACRVAARTPALPDLLASQFDVLLGMAERTETTSLDSYAVVAHARV